MKPGRSNFEIVQGDTFTSKPAWKVNNAYVDVTGYSALMDVKIAPTSVSNIIELSSANGRITVGTTDGTFTLNLTPAETTDIPVGNYVYDLQITSPTGTVYTLLAGGFTITSQVSA